MFLAGKFRAFGHSGFLLFMSFVGFFPRLPSRILARLTLCFILRLFLQLFHWIFHWIFCKPLSMVGF